MLDQTDIDALYLQEFDVRWTRFSGPVHLEAPVNVTHVSFNGECSVGAFTYTNHTCEIHSSTIGRYCSIGQNTTINPGVHPVDFLTTHPLGASVDGDVVGMPDFGSFQSAAMTQIDRPASRLKTNRVTIGHDVWIGAKAIVMQGVTINTGAIVGAGAVVTHDVPAFAIVVGVPAKVLRYRFPPELCQQVLASQWWSYDLSALPRRNFSDVAMFLSDLKAAAPPRLAPLTVELPNAPRRLIRKTPEPDPAPDLQTAIVRHCRMSRCVFDIGANRGGHTRTMADHAPLVVAFEPNPGVLPHLLDQLPPHVRVEQIALSDRSGEADFYVDDREDMGGTASSLLRLDGLHSAGLVHPIRVRTESVDDYVDRTGLKPGLLKVDVQGYEPMVLEGAKRTILDQRPAIIFAMWKGNYPRFKPAFDWLKAARYGLTCLSDGTDAWARYEGGVGQEVDDDILAVPLAAPAA